MTAARKFRVSVSGLKCGPKRSRWRACVHQAPAARFFPEARRVDAASTASARHLVQAATGGTKGQSSGEAQADRRAHQRSETAHRPSTQAGGTILSVSRVAGAGRRHQATARPILRAVRIWRASDRRPYPRTERRRGRSRPAQHRTAVPPAPRCEDGRGPSAQGYGRGEAGGWGKVWEGGPLLTAAPLIRRFFSCPT